MTFTKKALVASSAAVALFTVADKTVSAQEAGPLDFWVARSVAEIKADAEKTSETKTYVVQYGDTLSTIAEATGVDMYVLAQINQISNLDLIFPETVLKLTYGANHQVTAVEVAAPTQVTAVPETTVSVAPSVVSEASTVNSVSEASQQAPEKPVPAQEVAPALETETTTETPKASEVTPEAPAEAVTVPVAEPVTSQVTEVYEVVSETPEVSSSESTEVKAEVPIEEMVEAAVPVSSEAAPAVTTEASTTVAPTVTPIPVAATVTQDATSKPENAGLSASAANFKEEVASLFGITSFSLLRPGADDDHGKGLAVDFMVPVGSDLGDQVAQYAVDTLASRNISYIIWEQKFYSPWPSIYGPAYTWNPMPDRGSITANHYDHVHVSFNN
ncbi:LysM peptidoglycan-binding domain-containing protein [Streptococcus plurextorum]|uniref:LysM peptidoglycan-binding domain-containing protein n=1 Tax=Streptococcus plurextorum TaxID=456876 RepID=UPI000406E9E6|nr:LysM domain-containing protein [Streptococcus plurextorum]